MVRSFDGWVIRLECNSSSTICSANSPPSPSGEGLTKGKAWLKGEAWLKRRGLGGRERYVRGILCFVNISQKGLFEFVSIARKSKKSLNYLLTSGYKHFIIKVVPKLPLSPRRQKNKQKTNGKKGRSNYEE